MVEMDQQVEKRWDQNIAIDIVKHEGVSGCQLANEDPLRGVLD